MDQKARIERSTDTDSHVFVTKQPDYTVTIAIFPPFFRPMITKGDEYLTLQSTDHRFYRIEGAADPRLRWQSGHPLVSQV
ncbi:hypothetical protein DV711_04790 [Motiliproteus coralliicola]|uniref:Uncharacterized protein n=1 Tax=Motiliproteus coralliicola TaxID=2283196 RepID=A0A369WT87_9GAMM|nr:hypothetical protein DV711_04790 [Motiliproteus coralliicola]